MKTNKESNDNLAAIGIGAMIVFIALIASFAFWCSSRKSAHASCFIPHWQSVRV